MDKLTKMMVLGYAVLVFVSVAFAQGAPLTRIEINSSWDGLGNAGQSKLVITGSPGSFSSNGISIDPRAVQDLLSSMDEPYVNSPSLEACGVTVGWLNANYVAALEDYTHSKIEELSPKQIQIFQSKFTDPAVADQAFAQLFQIAHTDDYPEITIKVKKGTKEWGVVTHSQHPFLLPWQGIDQSRGGFNCRISSALAKLLPGHFANRSRLIIGEAFRWSLAEEVLNLVRNQFDAAEVEFKIGKDIAPVLKEFSVEKSSLSNISSVDTEGHLAWNATLHSKSLPDNLKIGVSLRSNGQHVFGISEFLDAVNNYLGLVMHSKVASYLAANSSAHAELRFVEGTSLSQHAREELLQDLRKHGATAIAHDIEQNAAKVAFLEIQDGQNHWSRVVVLPSAEILLWHFQGERVLGQKIGARPWDYYGWKGVGVILDNQPSE